MTISKKLRFEVFKRDGFKCAYCGKSPPEVMLEIDHIDPKSKGGKDEINNLITACFDCNRGKGSITLDKIPNQVVQNLEILKLKDQQLKEYQKYVRKIENKINKDIRKVEIIFQKTYPDFSFTEKLKEVTIKNFLKNFLLVEEIEEAMHIACACIYEQGRVEECIKYFCGVCWRKARNRK